MAERQYTAADFDEQGQFKRDPRYMADESVLHAPVSDGQDELSQLLAERKRRDDAAARQTELDSLLAEQARRKQGLIDTSPMPTGIERIDRAGETIPHQYGSGPYAVQVDRLIPSMDDLPFDHPDVVRKGKADKGINMIDGASFGLRAKFAGSPDAERLAKGALLEAMKSELSQVPEGVESMKWDPELGEFQILTPSAENEGQFRWTSLDGTGLEAADFADMLDPAEWMSLAGGIAGTVYGPNKLKWATKLNRGGHAAAGGTVGALGGRYLGEAINYLRHYKNTGKAPTWEEIFHTTKDATATELIATALTEAGAKIIRAGSYMTQEFALRQEGKQGVRNTEDLTQVNKNIRDSKKVMEEMNQGGMQYSLTYGQATRSIPNLASEAAKLKSANSKTQQAFNTATAQNDRALRAYLRRSLGGDVNLLADTESIIVAANDALASPHTFTVALTDNGKLHIIPKLADDVAKATAERRAAKKAALQESGMSNDAVENALMDEFGDEPVGHYGLVIDIDDPYTWQVNTAKIPESVRRMGLGSASYKTAAEEARGMGAVLGSGDSLSPDAIALWRKMDKDGTLGDLEWNKAVDAEGNPVLYEATDAEGNVWLKTTDGSPVVRMKELSSVTDQMLEQYVKPGETVTGRMEANKSFRDYMRVPAVRGALRPQVVEEMERNPHVRQNMKEAILADYEKRAKDPSGNLSVKEWTAWRDEVATVLSDTFTPEELVHIMDRPQALRHAVVKSREGLIQGREALAKVIGVPPDDKMFLEPSMRKLFGQFKGRTGEQRRRAMKIMDAQGMGEQFRENFKHELQLDLLNKTKASNYPGFAIWLRENNKLIQDVLGDTEYSRNLVNVARVLQRKTDAGMIRGAAHEANPTGLALFRVVFGPLSRIQRGLTGLRRGQVRLHAAQAADLISSPKELRELANMRAFEVKSRQAARLIQDLDIHTMLGMPDFDPRSEEDRQAMANQVMILLQEELSENVEPR